MLWNPPRLLKKQNQSSMPSENTMRSELVFGAMENVPNRFLLIKLAAKATRKFHRPNTRIQETMDDVFVRFSHANPIAEVQETGNVQPFRRAKKTKTHSRYENWNQSVA
jgi:hypothetical protein